MGFSFMDSCTQKEDNMIINTARDYNDLILNFLEVAVTMHKEKEAYKKINPKAFNTIFSKTEDEYDRHYNQYLQMHNGLLKITENELKEVNNDNFNSFEISSSYLENSIYIETNESLYLINDMMTYLYVMLGLLEDVDIPPSILSTLVNTPMLTPIKFNNGVIKRNNADIRLFQYKEFIKYNNQKTKDAALMLFKRIDIIQLHMWFISKVFNIESVKFIRSCPSISLSGRLYIRSPKINIKKLN